MTVTKADLVQAVYTVHNIPKQEAFRLVEEFLDLAKGCLESGDDLLLSGFGKFKIKDKKPRRGRNPQTGETLILDARRVVTFKPSGILRKRINGG